MLLTRNSHGFPILYCCAQPGTAVPTDCGCKLLCVTLPLILSRARAFCFVLSCLFVVAAWLLRAWHYSGGRLQQHERCVLWLNVGWGGSGGRVNGVARVKNHLRFYLIKVLASTKKGTPSPTPPPPAYHVIILLLLTLVKTHGYARTRTRFPGYTTFFFFFFTKASFFTSPKYRKMDNHQHQHQHQHYP